MLELLCPLWVSKDKPILIFLLINAFDIFSHNLYVSKLNTLRLSSTHASCFRSYYSNRQYCVCDPGTLPFPFVVESEVPQESFPRHLDFNVF
jgi:hypothetical protein